MTTPPPYYNPHHGLWQSQICLSAKEDEAESSLLDGSPKRALRRPTLNNKINAPQNAVGTTHGRLPWLLCNVMAKRNASVLRTLTLPHPNFPKSVIVWEFQASPLSTMQTAKVVEAAGSSNMATSSKTKPGPFRTTSLPTPISSLIMATSCSVDSFETPDAYYSFHVRHRQTALDAKVFTSPKIYRATGCIKEKEGEMISRRALHRHMALHNASFTMDCAIHPCHAMQLSSREKDISEK